MSGIVEIPGGLAREDLVITTPDGKNVLVYYTRNEIAYIVSNGQTATIITPLDGRPNRCVDLPYEIVAAWWQGGKTL
jgi:hypothetical protein